jgi:serralysin
LLGNDGSDYLSGQQGNDTLTGGGGSDTFVFTEGHDIVTDFDFRVDTIVIHGTLLPTSGVTSDNLSNFATFEDDRVILSFDEENTLTLLGQSGQPNEFTLFDSFEFLYF